MPYDEVVLIRREPDETGLGAVRFHLLARSDRRLLLFFHGPGLSWATSAAGQRVLADAEPDVTLMVCAAGWRRRQTGMPPAGWELGSLIQFWDAVDRAAEVVTFGFFDD